MANDEELQRSRASKQSRQSAHFARQRRSVVILVVSEPPTTAANHKMLQVGLFRVISSDVGGDLQQTDST